MSDGEPEVERLLIPLVYAELRRLASYYLHNERDGHTLQSTALVHETYLRLIDVGRVNWQGRSHFFGLAAHLMRRILVDYARVYRADKRGGSRDFVPLDEAFVFSKPRSDELLALDDALNRLSQLDERQSRVVEMRFFGGLTEQEIAVHLGVSERTIKREWQMAKAWLYRDLNLGAKA